MMDDLLVGIMLTFAWGVLWAGVGFLATRAWLRRKR